MARICRRRRRSCSRKRKRLRGRSSVFFYFLKHYRKCMPRCPMNRVAKAAARRWNSMSVAQKCKYRRLLARTGRKYQPISPFILFYMRYRKCPRNRGKPVTRVAREAATCWRRMTPAQKCHYTRASRRIMYGRKCRRSSRSRRRSCRRRRRSSCRRRRQSSCRRRRRSSCRRRRSSCRRRRWSSCRRRRSSCRRRRRSSCRRRRRSSCRRRSRSSCRRRRRSSCR